MRILKLRFTNFLPYYGEDNEIVLFDENRLKNNVTLNIGPTGTGKTSISRAVMFCLFGDQYVRDWETLICDLAIEMAKEKRERLVKVGIEMDVEIDGDVYTIQRVGEYDSDIGKRESDAKLYVRHDGQLIPDAETFSFINDRFPTVTLMEYFIFDADDMLRLFDENREKTIKDHINKIVGVETLDNMSDSLGKVISLYEEEIADIKNESPGISKAAVEAEEKKKKLKTQAIDEQEKEVERLEKEKMGLFPKGHLSPEHKRLKEIMDRQHAAEEEIKELNKKFEENKELVSNLHLLFLKEIIAKSTEIVDNTETTKAEFDGAISTLKSTLNGKYGGIVLSDKDTLLIRGAPKLKDSQLETTEKLKLGEGSGIKSLALEQLGEANSITISTEKEFLNTKVKFDEAMKKESDARNLLKQIGGATQTNTELKAKIDKFLAYEKEITERKKLLVEIGDEAAKIDERIRELTKDQKSTVEIEKRVKEIQRKAEATAKMKKITDATRKAFLQELLDEVNRNATDFFREVVRKDDPRLDSIYVDSNYIMNIKNKNGGILDLTTINKGNMQVALMAFFFGLSKSLKNKLPYIIDDPLIRLDPGHDKRLVTELCKSEQQLIMHMIPGKEYTLDSFTWLRPFVNTQNWINRETQKKGLAGKLRSFVEQKDATKFVEYNIDKL